MTSQIKPPPKLVLTDAEELLDFLANPSLSREMWPCGTLLCGRFSSTESTRWETVSEPHGLMTDWLETLVKFNYARKYNKAELELKYVSSPVPVHPLCLSASARV